MPSRLARRATKEGEETARSPMRRSRTALPSSTWTPSSRAPSVGGGSDNQAQSGVRSNPTAGEETEAARTSRGRPQALLPDRGRADRAHGERLALPFHDR